MDAISTAWCGKSNVELTSNPTHHRVRILHFGQQKSDIIIIIPAASMLIRNMLRVNPERRADIDEIASHWWLNLEENMPVIQELPENQVRQWI